MSQPQFAYSQSRVIVNKSAKQTVSLRIPLKVNTVFLIFPQQYQVIRIRTSEVLYEGQIPYEFTPSQYIEPLKQLRSKCVLLADGEGNICQINYKDGLSQLHQIPSLVSMQRPGKLYFNYWIYDENGQYLLGLAKSLQNQSTSVFIYDIVSKNCSNLVNLGSGFFNTVISNLNHYEGNLSKSQFVLISEQEKKMCYNYLRTQSKIINGRPVYDIFQTGKKTIAYEHCPRVAYLEYPYFYSLTNSKQGPYLVITNLQQNSSNKKEIKCNLQNQKGVIRENLRFADERLFFTVMSLQKASQIIYQIKLDKFYSFREDFTKNIDLIPLIDVNLASSFKLTSIFRRCLCDSSLQNYVVQKYASIQGEIHETDREFKTRTIYKVPIKYLYAQIAKQIGFSAQLIEQMLLLL